MQTSDILIAEPGQADDEVSWTAREIAQQPSTLRDTQALLVAEDPRIAAFLTPLLAQEGLRIVLTGAGTSAFIGESLAPWLSLSMGRSVEAIPTTDIVSSPRLTLRRDAPTLLVSFGRSGSSPESIAAVDLADACIDQVHHLVITCNAEGELARRDSANACVLILPEATHDRGFAMTSSFSAMMYAALAIFTGSAGMDERAAAIASGVEAIHAPADDMAAQIAGREFARVVYLGSGVFKGLAREAALKLLELSDGALVTAFDTTLGFRHGPKTIVNDRTLIVVFVSNDPLTRRYDLDMLEELRSDGRAGAVITVAARALEGEGLHVEGMDDAADVDLLFPYIVPAQLIGLHVSLALSLTPDRPNVSGTVSRVVQGVRIHPLMA